LDTKPYGLRIDPSGEYYEDWVVKVYSDSDWTGDKTNRKIVSGYVIFIKQIPVIWKPRLPKSVSLSTSEAECYALSEAAKEIDFLVQIL
jgi:hypothetical protein